MIFLPDVLPAQMTGALKCIFLKMRGEKNCVMVSVIFHFPCSHRFLFGSAYDWKTLLSWAQNLRINYLLHTCVYYSFVSSIEITKLPETAHFFSRLEPNLYIVYLRLLWQSFPEGLLLVVWANIVVLPFLNTPHINLIWCPLNLVMEVNVLSLLTLSVLLMTL